ncbi:MAG: class I SAM-dependent methyltransferase, partial [Patescibacteria group bacterium]
MLYGLNESLNSRNTAIRLFYRADPSIQKIARRRSIVIIKKISLRFVSGWYYSIIYMDDSEKKIIEKIYDYVFRAKTKEEEWKAWESLKKRDRDINIVPREIKDTGERKYYTWLVNEIRASIDGCSHNILEVGGTCATAFYFRKISPAIQCTLIDNNDTALEYARWIFGTEPIKIIKGDAKDLPVEDNKYDLVCSSGLIEHFDDGE